MLDINSTCLRELRLNWNHIKAPGGLLLASSLRNNTYLKVLDLAWNSLGSGGSFPGQVGKTWGEALATNKVLVHLDLSFNKIGIADTEIFAGLVR